MGETMTAMAPEVTEMEEDEDVAKSIPEAPKGFKVKEAPKGFKIKQKEGGGKEAPPGFAVKPQNKVVTLEDAVKKRVGEKNFVKPIPPDEWAKMDIWQRKEHMDKVRDMVEPLVHQEQFKGALSGLSFGWTERFESLKPDEQIPGAGGAQFAASMVPIAGLQKLFGWGLGSLASKSPFFQKQLSSLANLTSWGVTGFTVSGAEQAAKGKIPSVEDMLVSGAEWMAVDLALTTLGKAGVWAKNMIKPVEAGKTPWEVVNEVMTVMRKEGIAFDNPEVVSAKALEIIEGISAEAEQVIEKQLSVKKPIEKALAPEISEGEKAISKVGKAAITQPEITPKSLKSKKLDPKDMVKLKQGVNVKVEPYEPATMSYEAEAENLTKSVVNEELETLGPRAASKEELGTSVKSNIEEMIEADKEVYRPLYAISEEASHQVSHIPINTGKIAGDTLQKIGKLKTKPEGYQKVIKTLETVLEDSGFQIQRVNGEITEIISTKKISVNDSIELARRINEMIVYDNLEYNVQDQLKRVVKALKQDIRTGLASNKNALDAFEMAEEEFGKVAEKWSAKSIKGIRTQEAGEKIAKSIEQPSTLGQLKERLSPEKYKQVEREILENLNDKSYDSALKQFRELEQHLSPEGKKIGNSILDSKNPHNPKVRQKAVQDSILSEMSNSLVTGERPKKTLDLWKTTKGQKIVKDTFHNSPNWPEVENYLQKQSFADMVHSFTTEKGTIDFKKFREYMKDPASINNIRMMGGEDAVQFFRSMESKSAQLEKNAKLLNQVPSNTQINDGILKSKKGVGRGKEKLEKTKEKNLLKSEEAAKKEAKKEAQVPGIFKDSMESKKQVAKDVQGKKESGLGAQRIESTREKNLKTLKEIFDKNFPMKARKDAWSKYIEENLKIKGAAATKFIAGAVTTHSIGLPASVLIYVGERVLDNMLTSQRVRRAFSEAAAHQSNPILFLMALNEFGDSIED